MRERADARSREVLARGRLVRASSLHSIHWLVVVTSVALTVTAWWFSKQQIEERVEKKFEREAEQVVELVTERMQHYEDGLWGGVGAIAAQVGTMTHRSWKAFSRTLSLDVRYPGILGIGVIYDVNASELETYLAAQRRERPNFRIHPAHTKGEYLPITFIEPLESNDRAVGLDMAHERNRYSAAKRARDSGAATITGPIVLVQDAEKTPGFLLFAPFYRGGAQPTLARRRETFEGIVYAPFIVSKLMEGALAKENRHVAISITDGDDVLYDEHIRAAPDFDTDPQFKRRTRVDIYGREWTFSIWSTKAFRAATTSAQPATILVGGLVIDALLLAMFISLTRSNRRAVEYADLANGNLQAKTLRLEESNADLEQFAYVASHDLQEPIRMVRTYAELLTERYGETLDERGRKYTGYLVDGAIRMQGLVDALLSYSRVERGELRREETSAAKAVEEATANLRTSIEETSARVLVSELPTLSADPIELARVFQNLIGNGLKYQSGVEAPVVRIDAQRQGPDWLFSVADNGIGIESDQLERVFQLFNRVHDRGHFDGDGIGLAVSKKIVERHGGTIWVESTVDVGSTFYFTVPVEMPAQEKVPAEGKVEDG